MADLFLKSLSLLSERLKVSKQDQKRRAGFLLSANFNLFSWSRHPADDKFCMVHINLMKTPIKSLHSSELSSTSLIIEFKESEAFFKVVPISFDEVGTSQRKIETDTSVVYNQLSSEIQK